MYGQRRWTVPAPPSLKLGSTTIYKTVTEMCGCITAFLRCPFPAERASAVHSEIPVTPVHTCSDLFVH